VWESTCGVAFDCATSTVISGALRMPIGVPILFDTSGAGGSTINRLLSSTNGLDHQFNGSLTNRLLGTGGLQVGAVQVIGPRINGYGTPTGGSHQASFAAGSITLPNLAAAVAQLIIDLETHGMIGT
jgi:hypothetical protein